MEQPPLMRTVHKMFHFVFVFAIMCLHIGRTAASANATITIPQFRDYSIRSSDGVPFNFNFHGFPGELILGSAKAGAIDMLSLANAALTAADGVATSYLRYFQEEDLPSVIDVFQRILTETSLEEGLSTKTVDFYFNVWDKIPIDPNRCNEDKKLLAFARERAVTADDKNIILCAELFRRHGKNLVDIPCNSLQDMATWKDMDSIGATILHEMIHLGSFVGVHIDDITVTVAGHGEIKGYGPYAAMMVNRLDKFGVLNAENYVWFALEAYFLEECKILSFAHPQYEEIDITR